MKIKVIVTVKQSNTKENCYEGFLIVNENKITYQVVLYKSFKKDHDFFGKKITTSLIKKFKLRTIAFPKKEKIVEVNDETFKFLISTIAKMIKIYNENCKITDFNENNNGFEELDPLNSFAKDVGSRASLEISESFTCDEKLIPFELKNKKPS